MSESGIMQPARSRIIAAYVALYLIWGSTYLAIYYAIQTLPPFLMAGARFVVAGALMYAWARLRGGVAAPTTVHWRSAAIVGALLLLGGNGAVVWAQQTVPSGIASLLVATMPLWLVLLEWLRPGGTRPGLRVAAGILLGFAGLVLLVAPGVFTDDIEAVSVVGAIVLVLGALSWAAGSLVARDAPLPASPSLANGMQMLAGGVWLLIAGIVAGEGTSVDLFAVSVSSAIGFAYLVVFGSLIGFTSFVFLLKVEPSARVSTYAYVNPVVAVMLGWIIVGERLTGTTMLAAAVILLAVALIVTGRTRLPVPDVASPRSTPFPPAVAPSAPRRRRRGSGAR